jgi:diguanylate cyclase (GGDEF)-like protein
MLHHIRAVDLLFRWGGEEFLLLLPGCAIPRAKELLERIRRDLHDQPVSLLNQKTVPPSSDQLRPDLLPVTISIGLSVHRSEESSAELLQRVDEALYCAKRGGRNRLCTA